MEALAELRLEYDVGLEACARLRVLRSPSLSQIFGQVELWCMWRQLPSGIVSMHLAHCDRQRCPWTPLRTRPQSALVPDVLMSVRFPGRRPIRSSSRTHLPPTSVAASA